MRCLRCGRRVGAQESGLKEMEEALAIWKVKVKGDGSVEAKAAGGESDCGSGRGAKGHGTEECGAGARASARASGKRASGREAACESGAKVYGREVKAHGREDSVDPHIALTSSDKSLNLICSKCLHVLLPLLFPTTSQPERITLGLEDIRLARYIPTILGALGGYPGHIEVEHLGEDVLVRRHTVGGGSEAYTVGRSGDLVRVPGQRPVGGSKVKENGHDTST